MVNIENAARALAKGERLIELVHENHPNLSIEEIVERTDRRKESLNADLL